MTFESDQSMNTFHRLANFSKGQTNSAATQTLNDTPQVRSMSWFARSRKIDFWTNSKVKRLKVKTQGVKAENQTKCWDCKAHSSIRQSQFLRLLLKLRLRASETQKEEADELYSAELEFWRRKKIARRAAPSDNRHFFVSCWNSVSRLQKPTRKKLMSCILQS